MDMALDCGMGVLEPVCGPPAGGAGILPRRCADAGDEWGNESAYLSRAVPDAVFSLAHGAMRGRDAHAAWGGHASAEVHARRRGPSVYQPLGGSLANDERLGPP